MTKEVLELNRLTELSQYELEGNFVLVAFPKIEEKTKSGVIKSEQVINKEVEEIKKSLKFTVAKVGEGCTKTIKGERVIINGAIIVNQLFTPVYLDGNEYGQFYENDIIGRFK